MTQTIDLANSVIVIGKRKRLSHFIVAKAVNMSPWRLETALRNWLEKPGQHDSVWPDVTGEVLFMDALAFLQVANVFRFAPELTESGLQALGFYDLAAEEVVA